MGLHQNYPNPFNPTTAISFTLKEENTTELQLLICNIRGQKIIDLTSNLSGTEFVEKGVIKHNVIWNSEDANGRKVASEIYYYRLTTGKNNYLKKMILIK